MVFLLIFLYGCWNKKEKVHENQQTNKQTDNGSTNTENNILLPVLLISLSRFGFRVIAYKCENVENDWCATVSYLIWISFSHGCNNLELLKEVEDQQQQM